MTFWKWLLAQWKRLSLPLAAMASLYATNKAWYPYLAQAWPLLRYPFVIPALNFGVALIALFYRPHGPSLDKTATDRLAKAPQFDEPTLRRALGVWHDEKWDTRAHQAHTAVTQFVRCWTGVWIAWALQYGLMAVWQSPLAASLQLAVAPTVFDVLEAAISTTNTLMLLLCFLAMWAVTVNKKGDPEFKIAPYIGVTIAVVLIEAVVPQPPRDPLVIVDKINGVISGVVLAMFVGRLENKYLGTPILAVVSLYIYAAIQPLHVLTLEQMHPLQRDIILGAALLLKIPLLLVVAWLLDSGKFLFYMARVRSIHDHVQGDWDAFRHIVGK